MNSMSRRPVAVVDIDGVLADVRHRLRFVHTRPKDWQSFFATAPDDPLLAEGAAVVARLSRDHDLVYLSGRPERCRADTQRWLQEHGLPSAPVRLRRDGDRRPARVTKLEELRRLAQQRDVAVLVDDDPAVCAAAERAGFTVFRATWMAEEPALFEAQERDGRS
ncbi:MAG: hypothetical protein M3P83_12595 [Actinomycetota bacterium]|nr:hypothetical protein [Actinomycetota bacterium]